MIGPTRKTTRRRAFVFLWVLALMMIATLLIGGGLRQTVARANIVARQIESYERHHEMLSMRDIVWTRLRGMDTEELEQRARQGERAIRERLSNEITIAYTLEDGQGTIRVMNPDDIPDSVTRHWMTTVLEYLPPDTFDRFTRRSGPMTISLRAAPDEVLTAVARGDEDLRDALIRARDSERIENQAELVEALQGYGVDANEAMQTARRFDFDPELWKVRIEAYHAERNFSAQYEILARVGRQTFIHEWRQIR